MDQGDEVGRELGGGPQTWCSYARHVDPPWSYWFVGSAADFAIIYSVFSCIKHYVSGVMELRKVREIDHWTFPVIG